MQKVKETMQKVKETMQKVKETICMTVIRTLSRSTQFGLLLVIGLMVCAGCAQTPPPDPAPPPHAEAHPLPDVQGKQARPKLPKLPGDTRS